MNQVQMRKEQNQRHIKNSYINLSDAVGRKRHYDALDVVFDYMKIKESDAIDRSDALSALQIMGVMKREITLEGKWYRHAAALVWAELSSGDYTALVPCGTGCFKYFDLERKCFIKITKHNAESFNKKAFYLYRSFNPGTVTPIELFKFIFKSVNKRSVIAALVISFALALLGLLIPVITQKVFNIIIPAGTPEDIPAVAALFLGIIISVVCFQLMRTAIIHNIISGIGINLEGAVFSRLLSLKLKIFKEYQPGNLSSRITEFADISGIISSECISVFVSFLFSFVYLVQIYVFAPSLIVPAMLILLILVLFIFVETYLQTVRTKEYSHNASKLRGFVFEAFLGITKIKLSAAESRVFSRWSKIYAETSKILYNPPVAIKYAGAIYRFILFSGTILIFYAAASANLSSATYITFTASFGALTGTLLQMDTVIASASKVKIALEMLKPILHGDNMAEIGKKIPTDIKGNIEISNLKFSYSADMPPVINGVSLNISAGECIGITGSSGGGKSTLIRVLLGFEKPPTGAVYFDGHDISECDIRAIRRHIGVVAQTGKLMNGDIYSNIVMSAPGASLEDAWRAAEIAGIKEDIEEMPMGMYTIISEKGGGLSGGQKQKLMIARAVAHNPKILLLDEATSALDNATQAKVSEFIDNMKCTRIVVAHRLSTLKQCDRIIVLDKGVIEEEGSFDELMAKQKLFYSLMQRQFL